MVDRADINAVDDAAWEQAVAREAVIRRLASKAAPNRAAFLKACRDLGLKRSRLYELISAYKARPVASSLLAAQVGTPTGSRRLPDEIEAVIRRQATSDNGPVDRRTTLEVRFATWVTTGVTLAILNV